MIIEATGKTIEEAIESGLRSGNGSIGSAQ